MVLVELVELIVYVNRLLHIPRDLQGEELNIWPNLMETFSVY